MKVQKSLRPTAMRKGIFIHKAKSERKKKSRVSLIRHTVVSDKKEKKLRIELDGAWSKASATAITAIIVFFIFRGELIMKTAKERLIVT